MTWAAFFFGVGLGMVLASSPRWYSRWHVGRLRRHVMELRRLRQAISAPVLTWKQVKADYFYHSQHARKVYLRQRMAMWWKSTAPRGGKEVATRASQVQVRG